MVCTILNRNYPPGLGITGSSANELAAYLESHGVEVHIVTCGGYYHGGAELKDTIHGQVHKLRSVYSGKNKLIRLFSSLYEGWKMARTAVALNKGPLISMTDPPLLNYWVARIARKKKIPWMYWSMDVYPEAFVAGKLITQKNPFYRYIKNQLTTSPPHMVIALGPNQLRYIVSALHEKPLDAVLPCGITAPQEKTDTPSWLNNDQKIYLGYIGNLGEAHDERFIKAVIDSINPDHHHLILAVYGSKAKSVLKYAERKPGVTNLDKVDRNHLGFIDIHLVSLLPTWDHISVPSKAVSAVCEGSSVLFCCSEENDNWEMLQEAGWRIEADANFSAVIPAFMNTLTNKDVLDKRQKAEKLSDHLQLMQDSAFKKILAVIGTMQ